jgi:phospholipid/cholesterol/gamma-HCH transport system substrate-binding protein
VTTTRRLGGAVTALLLSVTLTGCGPDFGDLPLPGQGVSGETMDLNADFEEALNLAQGATVKVNGISVGKVQEVTTENFRAKVTMKVQKDSQIRQGATARLRYTTPLGELFVDVSNPEQGALLKDDANMGTDVTDTAPTVEDSLASASLLINGGGLSQLEQVTTELNNAIGGREETIKQTFRSINVFLKNANASTANFDRALTALTRVSSVLARRQDTINRAVREITPAAKVLRENTDEFVALTKALVKFTGTANDLASQSKDRLISILRQAEPILAELQSLKGVFGPGLSDLVAVSKSVDKVVPGDYLNLNIMLVLKSIGGAGGTPETPIPELPIPELPLPPIPGLPDLGLPDLGLPDLGLAGLRTAQPTSTSQPSETGLTALTRGAR